jgi:hypothetical protein
MIRTSFGSMLRALPLLAIAGMLSAQTPAVDVAAKLREVLPVDVAERVIARIEAARSRELPAEALERSALKFAARGIDAASIERAVSEQAVRLEAAQSTLQSARAADVSDAEVEAGAEAMRQGVDGEAIGALAQSAPSGRSLAVPLFVIGSLVERGLPSDDALARVQERLLARATDAELTEMAEVQGLDAQAAGLERAAAARAGARGGAPVGVPATGGARTAPVTRPPVSAPPPAGPARP